MFNKKKNNNANHNFELSGNVEQDILMLFNKLQEQEKQIQELSSLQKIIKNNFSSFAVRRFNPYEEAGGDLSFCLVFLNGNGDGVMITSLHARERTRIYTRQIIQGKIEAELLYDEQETLKQAYGNL